MSARTVWIINHYASSPTGASHTRHFDLAKFMRGLGWKTCIFASSVEVNTHVQRLGGREQDRSEVYSGVNFRWIYTPDYQDNGTGRIINMLAFTWRLLLKKTTADLPPPDVIIGSSGHALAAAAAAILARRYRVPFIFEVRDITPETYIALGYMRRYSPYAIFLAQLEKWLCRRASKVVSVIPGYADYLSEHKIRAPEVVHIPNGVNLDNIGNILPYKKRDIFRITYLGAHGTANDLHTLIRAMEIIEVSQGIGSIECHLIGAGPIKQELVDYCTVKGLKQVFFHSPIAKNKIAETALETDAFIICLKKLPSVFKYGVGMNKLSDYLAMGRPVITIMESANNPVVEAEAGIRVQPESPEELADAISMMPGMSEEKLREMGQKGRRYAEKTYDMRVLAGRLAGILDRI